MRWLLAPALFIFLLFFTGCERTVEFDLDNVEPKLVVEATIENDQPPVVILSKSVGYFSKIDPLLLANSFVHGAEINISNGILTHRLKEYSVNAGNGVLLFYYSIDSANLSTAFVGELGKNYSLQILAEGVEYNSSTRIPFITKRIDSVYWKQAPPNNPPEKVALMIRATDPPGLGDYVRYFTKQNSGPFLPGLNSVFDDQVIDNSTYEVQVEKGVDRTSSLPEGYAYFNKGDTVTFKLSN